MWPRGAYRPQTFSEKTGKPDTRGVYGLLGQEMITALTPLQHVRDFEGDDVTVS